MKFEYAVPLFFVTFLLLLRGLDWRYDTLAERAYAQETAVSMRGAGKDSGIIGTTVIVRDKTGAVLVTQPAVRYGKRQPVAWRELIPAR